MKNTPAQDLAWERWQRCDRFASVVLERMTPDGGVHVRGSVPGEMSRWQTCMTEAARDQHRERVAARPQPVLTPIEPWGRALCRKESRAVRSPWDAEIKALHDRLAAVVAAELPRDLVVVVVDTLGESAAAVCRSGAQSTLARLMAHELGHLALWHGTGPAEHTSAQMETLMEIEADEFAAFVLERAGIGCRAWIDALRLGWATAKHWKSLDDERSAIASACELARRGERPPRRLTPTRSS